MYHKHQTEGIILKTFESGDSSAVALMFTRNLGMVYAKVQNGRGLKSKMRADVQDFTWGRFVLIKGASGWKLAGALGEKNIWSELRKEKLKVKKMVGILSLIRSYLAQEGGHSRIFVHLKDFLFKLPTVKADKVETIERATLLKILSETGTLRKEKDIQELIDKLSIDDAGFEFIESRSQLVVSMINESFRALEIRM